MSYPYHMALWDRVQHQAHLCRVSKERQEAVDAYLAATNTPEGASGRSQAVVSHEGRAVAARGSRPQSFAGTHSARATVSTTAAAPVENPGTHSQIPLDGVSAGTRLRQAKQIIGQGLLL